MEEKKKEKAPQIYGAIARVMRETKAIGKTEKNQQQGFMFRGIDNVMNELHDLFANNGVFILPEVLDFEVSEKTTGRGTILYYTRAKVKFHFTAEDGSEVCTVNVGEAMDSGDKGMNKAMSIALKYALMQMLLIPTKEDKDPDAVTPEDTVPRKEEDLVTAAMEDIQNAKTREQLQAVWKKWNKVLPQLFQPNAVLYNEFAIKGQELNQKTA